MFEAVMQNLLPCIIISPDELPTAPVIEYFTAMPLAALYAAMALLKTASPVPAAAESEAIANIASKINFFIVVCLLINCPADSAGLLGPSALGAACLPGLR